MGLHEKEDLNVVVPSSGNPDKEGNFVYFSIYLHSLW